MGIFDWFKGTPSNVRVLDDVIWLTKQVKLNGIMQALSHRLAEQDGPDAVILVAHFRDCFDELRQIVEMVGVSGPVTVASAESLKSDTASGVSFGESQTIEIVVGEHHPLPSHDEAVLEFARSLPCRCRLVHHVSLEDPLMRAFCGEWVEKFLKTLGMAEDEAIVSNMVARRIKVAQKKIASQCVSDLPADSAEMWMERNCSEMLPRGQG